VAGRFSAGMPNGDAAKGSLSRRNDAEGASAREDLRWSWLTPVALSLMAAYFLGVALMTLLLTVALRGGR
jgi:hypothetical protein